MDLNIKGRRALVCGASKGLGLACAEALAMEGVNVTLAARGEADLAIAAERIEQASGILPRTVAADLSRPEGREAALWVCPDPDILVTNAGGPPGMDFRAIGEEHWDDALRTNFLSAVELIRACVDTMAERNFGRIVNITSMTVRMPVLGLDLSNSARLALTGYTSGVARQIAAKGVTVNNLLPGPIATDRLAALGETADALVARVPAGRAGRPEEFGAACAFLCSAQAGFITGQNILVDGGLCPVTV
jgi:3-oxoacyl-[acyl-carrier protein] reductase